MITGKVKRVYERGKAFDKTPCAVLGYIIVASRTTSKRKRGQSVRYCPSFSPSACTYARGRRSFQIAKAYRSLVLCARRQPRRSVRRITSEPASSPLPVTKRRRRRRGREKARRSSALKGVCARAREGTHALSFCSFVFPALSSVLGTDLATRLFSADARSARRNGCCAQRVKQRPLSRSSLSLPLLMKCVGG